MHCTTIFLLAVGKVGHLNIKTKFSEFKARVLIGWLARVFASQPVRLRASKSNIFLMLRWPTFPTASILALVRCQGQEYHFTDNILTFTFKYREYKSKNQTLIVFITSQTKVKHVIRTFKMLQKNFQRLS